MKLNSIVKIQISLPLVFNILLLTACNFTKVNRVEHEGATPEAPKATETPKADVNALRSMDLSAAYQKTINIKSAEDAMAVIKELESTVLKAEIISNPALNMEPTVVSSLSYYNIATLQLLTLAPESDGAKAQMTKYLETISRGCSLELDNCTRILWMKRDPRTHTVLSKIATLQDTKIPTSCKEVACEQDLKNLFRTISLSFASNNQIKDLELYQVFVKRIFQYSAVLEKNKEQEELKKQGLIFDSILANLSAEEDQKIILPIVKAQPPWNYSRRSGQTFNFGTEKIFLVASKNLLYENGTLNAQLKKLILDEQKNPKDKNESLYLKAKKLYSDPKTKTIFRTLNFDPTGILGDSFYDEYFYMLDRLMKSDLNYDEVEAIWKGSKKNVDIINKKIRDIARLELINLVVMTNEYFSALLQTKGLPSNRLFIKSIDESRPLTDTWDQYFSTLSKVSNLLGQISSNSQLSDAERANIQSTKNFMIGAKRNAKFLSVYPNMLNLGYFMMKVDAKFSTKTWWGATISIDPKTIVDYLLDGGFEAPWYLFSGDTNPINKSEIILAFDYALRLGSFEIFSQAKDDLGKSKIDRLQFFKALKSTMDENIKILTDTIETMQKLENDSDNQRALRFCSTTDFKKNPVKMKLDDFEQFAATGAINKGIIGAAQKFYDSANKYYSVPATTADIKVASLRNSLNGRFLQLRAMSLPLIENINSMDISENEKNDLKAKVNAEIKDVTKKLNTYYAVALDNHNLIKDCTQRLVMLERKQQFAFIDAEREYLEKVYLAMQKIYEQPADKKKELAASLANSIGLTTADALIGSNFINSKYDLFKRFESYSERPSAPVKISAEDPDETTLNNLKSDSKDIPFINPVDGKPLDKEIFIKNGLFKFNTQGSNTVQWFRNSTNTKLAQIKIESMIAVYKLGYDLGLQNSNVKYKERILKPISASDIIQEGIDLARSLSISSDEERVMRSIGQYELGPVLELQDYLFDISETKFNGIIDNIFLMATRVQDDLDEATRYYRERIATKTEDAMIFPIDQKIELAIHKVYHRLIKKDELLINDFLKALREKQKDVEANPLQIVYRLSEDSAQPKIYTSSLIPGANSILVDENKIKGLVNNVADFHNRLTFKVYQGPISENQDQEEK